MIQLCIGIAASISTFIGGSLALKFKDKIHLILGFSAGAVIGVALFDLLPEALSMGEPYHEFGTITAWMALGFVFYMAIDRVLSMLTSSAEEHVAHEHKGHVGAGSLTVHSFLDGLGIGLAFQVSPALGAVVAIAVLVHDFSDGINTVNMSLVGNGKSHTAKKWLFADALAPLLGIGVASFIHIPDSIFSIVLALFSGFFLYIGASELLPESHHRHPHIWTTFMTILGILVIYTAIYFASF